MDVRPKLPKFGLGSQVEWLNMTWTRHINHCSKNIVRPLFGSENYIWHKTPTMPFKEQKSQQDLGVWVSTIFNKLTWRIPWDAPNPPRHLVSLISDCQHVGVRPHRTGVAVIPSKRHSWHDVNSIIIKEMELPLVRLLHRCQHYRFRA